MFSHWSRPKPNASEGGWVIYSDLQEILLITLVVLVKKVIIVKAVIRTTGVINNISCKYEYITQPPSLAFGLGLDQWENM